MTQIQERLTSALADRYRIDRELGAGGMATVYLAEDLKHGRQVAIKVLREDVSASLGKERFLREVRIAAALQHPHVLPLYDSGDADGLLFYVMPFVDGQSLREKLLREGELPVGEAVRIMRDIADALSEAHKSGIVHRDLKPENVMLRGRHALVTDFGVAKALSEATGRHSLTTIGVALGTPTYMAPEQATADPHVDHRADIYAFGVLSYELLAGQPPFAGNTPQQVLAAHVTAAAEPVSKHRTLPPALAALIMRCLEKKPADRWQSAEELIPQLESVLTPSGGMTPTDTRPYDAITSQAPPVQRPSRLPLAGVATVVVIGAAAAAWAFLGREAPVDESRVLVVPFEVEGGANAAGALPQLIESAVLQGLQRTGLGSISDSRTAVAEVNFRDTSQVNLARPGTARALARELGAGLVVVGRVLVLGDSVQIEGKLVSTESGAEVVPIPAITGAIRDANALTDATSQRVVGALALYRDPQWGASLPGTRAPTYAAYREMQLGTEHFSRAEFTQAADRFERAYRLDTTFLVAAVRFGYAAYNAGQNARVDSLLSALDSKRGSMSPYETQYLARLAAWNRGDYQAAYAAAREMARAAPLSNVAQYTSARSALFVNRLAEARDGLLKVDVDGSDMAGVDNTFSDLVDVYHLLGDYETALAWADKAISHPKLQRPIEARAAKAEALAALGRLAELDSLVNGFLAPGSEGGGTFVSYAIAVMSELRWHGHDTTAARLAKLALQRMQASLPSDDRLVLLLFAGEVASATTLADSMVRASPGSRSSIWLDGHLAARRGDSARATVALRALERAALPGDRGLSSYFSAGIHAALGNRERATVLLQQSFSEGISFQGKRFHAQFFLEPLRGFPAFEAFVAPK